MKLLKPSLKEKTDAFTLTEVLVVMVIIGILVLIVLPNLLPVVTRAKTTEAKIQLKHVYMLEKNYFYEFSRYTDNLNDIDYIQQKLSTGDQNGKANYRIEITHAGQSAFTARATAVVDFNGDGKFNVWEIDQDTNLKEVVKD